MKDQKDPEMGTKDGIVLEETQTLRTSVETDTSENQSEGNFGISCSEPTPCFGADDYEGLF
ncbi:hypothetical protein CSB11_01775 [Candidatus Campbellbacteria bacterium]|nr:MAG: hypothetical protein CSB11_01775 [Candidatus Campbellbacteria bacterium]